MAAKLQFDQVSKRYGRALVLDRLTLQVEAGEIYGFLGPNGAGKTTAIQIAMGFARASSGQGQLLGMPFAQARAARASVGYVEDAPVFFRGSALEAVMFASDLNIPDGSPAQPKPASRSERRATGSRLLSQLDLPAQGKDARSFSRGMQQRLALAQALVNRPQLLILDEPTSALDPPTVLLVRHVLQQARDQGAAIFLSSHQLGEAEQLCDRAAFLQGGRLLRSGTMQQLLPEGAIARITLRGEPALATRLQGVGGSQRATHAEPAASRDLLFVVPVDQQQSFLEQAWLAGAELVSVERERQTLADLFAAGAPAETNGDASTSTSGRVA